MIGFAFHWSDVCPLAKPILFACNRFWRTFHNVNNFTQRSESLLR